MNIVCFHNPDEDNGYLSNWYPSSFTVDSVAFSSMEQFMMYRKAICFGDEAVAAQILSTSDVAKIKSLGRQVSNYDESMWNGIRQIVVYEGLLAKFSQNEEIKAKLKATGNAVLAECAVKDRIWGIGLSMKDPDRLNKAKWNGQNLLGYALMMVRERLQQDYSWEQRKLGEVAKYRNGKAHENCIDESGKYIVVNSKFVSTNGTVIKHSNMQNEPLAQNEIAFVLSDVPNGRAIARTFLVEENDKYTLNQRIAGITSSENTYPYFLHILMNRHPYFLAFDDGVKQTNLSVSDVLNFETYYPEYEEQKQIGEYFRNLDRLITLHQRELYKYLRYRILKVRRKS